MKIDNIFIDLDGVTADFETCLIKSGVSADVFKHTTGSYIWLQPMPFAIESIQKLNQILPKHVWFLTKPPRDCIQAWSEKAHWVRRYFGPEGLDQLIITQDKGLLGTKNSILIDDRAHKGNVKNSPGTFIHFSGTKSRFIDPQVKKLVDQNPLFTQPDYTLGWEHALCIINTIMKSDDALMRR